MSTPVPDAPTPPVAPQTVLFDMNSLINQVVEAVKPAVTQHAQSVVTQATGALQQTINAVADDVAANRKQIEQTAAGIGQSFASELTKDVWLQRLLTALVVVGALIGGLVLLVFYLEGNHQASDAIGWLGALFGVPLAAAVHQALGGPGAAKVPVAPVTTVVSPPVTTTTTVGATP